MNFYLGNSYSHLLACTGGGVSLRCPEKLFLDITEDCNISCPMCRSETRADGRTMPMELFKRLVDETSPYCKSYSLFIWGEPLILHDFRERVQYIHSCKRPECTIEISTNGMLLSEDTVRFLRRYDVRVIVSFDGAGAPTFERIRRGASFERVCKNTRALNRIYEDAPLDIAPATYTSIQKLNQSELACIVNKVSELGFRRVGFGIVTSPGEFAPCADIRLCSELQGAYNAARENELFIELYPARIGSYVFWGDKYVPAEDFVVRTRCDAPFINAVVSYDGEVCLCCSYGATAGNVASNSFLKVWTSPHYGELREAVNDPGNMPGPCRRCWWANRW